ncbi:MAG: hypothetical protein DRJ50_05705 [Actinobacteria bacterium]|nr:MAG: hypothetical protein DRJ50_05705 [Actinomycetota bacterium]
MSKRRYFLWAVVLLGICVTASAQSPDIDQIDARLEQRTDDVKQISDQLDAGDVPGTTLTAQLQTLLGYRDEIRNDAQSLKAALVEPSQRLSDLGPPPAEDQPAESDDIGKLRKTLDDEVTRLTGLSKKADLTTATIDRLIGHIRSLQGGRFFSSITKRSLSPFSARLWSEALTDIPPALDQLVAHVVTWREQLRTSGKFVADLALLVAALAGAIALLTAPLWPRWRRIATQRDENPSPAVQDRRQRVAARASSRGLLVAGAGALFYVAGVETGLVNQAGNVLALRLWIGSAMFVLVWNLALGVFSPGRRQALFIAVFGAFVLDRWLSSGFALTGAGIELTLALSVLASSVFAVSLWLLLSPKLWHGGTAPGAVWVCEILRIGGRLLAGLILLANALAYVRWASFVFHRLVLLALFLMLLWLVRILAGWGLSRLPALQSPAAETHKEPNEPDRESLSVWLRLALDLTLLSLSVPAFLLVVGFDWLDLRRWFELLNSDIHVGAVSLSFTHILSAVVVFLLVIVGTRWATSVVDKQLLQRARMDAGERNSINTLVNYMGVGVATLIALAIVGVGLSKLAIVAGALSVGIGFGLQGIVNNFVSGLILLFERPIKLGDWVVTRSGEGYVKQIGARATEIRTFDRASIIIPNSELVTSAVQNWFYKSKLGRIRVEVGVSYGSDPEQVRDILLDCAKQHPSISSSAAASVRWVDFGDSSLDFQLLAYLRNIDDARKVRSDLRFAIFKAFKTAGVEIPFPQRDVHMRPDGKATEDAAG